MNESFNLAWALLTGLGLGGLFFGGLWWTVQRGISQQRSALWFVGSLLLRVSLALSGFYLIGRDHWQPLVGCLLGFIVARLAVKRLTRPRASCGDTAHSEARHAP